MSLGQHHSWLLPGHLRPPDDYHDVRPLNGLSKTPAGSKTPTFRMSGAMDGSQAGSSILEGDTAGEEDPRIALFRDLYRRSEAKVNALFNKERDDRDPVGPAEEVAEESAGIPPPGEDKTRPTAPTKKPTRTIDEDDYDDYDDEDSSETAESAVSPLKAKSVALPHEQSPLPRPHTAAATPVEGSKDTKKESLEEIRKKLEGDKKVTEEAAKKSFHTRFYTLENDRDAMLDQQRLEESERLVEAEMSGHGVNHAANHVNSVSNGYGSLSNANLGASSLTLKNLIARIDMKRTMVQASDAELRSLMSEVRKNRSKWASEDKIGQEELYESAEKVLSELKAMTEHSTAFLTRVNKREAPDYYTSKSLRRWLLLKYFSLFFLANIFHSNQASHGLGDDDEEVESTAI